MGLSSNASPELAVARGRAFNATARLGSTTKPTAPRLVTHGAGGPDVAEGFKNYRSPPPSIALQGRSGLNDANFRWAGLIVPGPQLASCPALAE